MGLPITGPSRRRRHLLRARRGPAIVTCQRWAPLHVQRAWLPGRKEVVLVVRNFAAHVGHEAALKWVKSTAWGYDDTAEDMQFLTQWKFLNLVALGDLLGRRPWLEQLDGQVATQGFGQMRWYGAQRETTRHSDGFDGGEEVPMIGRSRSLLRLGGDGFLTFYFEKAGGRTGRLDLLLHHGDLVLFDRQIAGTLPNGLQRSGRLWVTHRAGGLLAKHCPRHLKSPDARSFVTLVWTLQQSREDFLASLLSCWHVTPHAPVAGYHCWPRDPRDLEDVRSSALLPWAPGLSLADRQVEPPEGLLEPRG